MKFGVLFISGVTVTLGPFLKKYLCTKEHKDRKVTFYDITILNSQTVLHCVTFNVVDIENMSFVYFRTI